MYTFQNTTLWKTAFGATTGDQNAEKKESLKQAFLAFRRRVEQLANEIHKDQPSFTVHDITHIDALWGTASLLVPDNFPLTPTEGFVFGGAILVHDLAMTLAAYPKGISELKSMDQWRDTITNLLQGNLARTPTEEEIAAPGAEIETEATRILLRSFHAKQAEKLPTVSWKSGDTVFHLIDDTDLRANYGHSIGQIAASHWWTLATIEKEFKTPRGAPGDYPNHWHVDELKLAALLRLADVCHLDDRRAPSFLRALRKPTGIANLHWTFQNKLLQPRVDSERLVFTSKTPFSVQEASAWWLCFDTLTYADRELRETTAMIVSSRPTLSFRVKGIRNVESPALLAEVIKPQGWLPVDAHVQVTDVASLARNLGGEQLYGDDKTVPLRELIQNAADAVRARRIFEGKTEKWGTVCVRTGEDADGRWIEVEDTGIGMSTDVLRGPFLDFGKSYWGSELMLQEWPGLLSKGFVPTGKFGVGFYSVFMWGNRVRVTTQKLGDAKTDTFTLQFGSGLDERPLLRPATQSERLNDGGTRVRVWLKEGLLSPKGLFPAERWEEPWKIDRLCEWLCPSLDVNLDVEEEGKRKHVITASDWRTMEGYRLFKRLTRDEGLGRYPKKGVEALKTELKKLRLIKDRAGKIVGRVCLLSYLWGERKAPEFAVVTAGGLRASSLTDYRTPICGVFAGRPTNATRRIALPTTDGEALAKWASEQAKLIKTHQADRWGQRVAKTIRSFGGETGPLAIGLRRGGSVSIENLRVWQNVPDKVLLINDDYQFREKHKSILLALGVLAIEFDNEPTNFLRDRFNSDEKWPVSEEIRLTPKRKVGKNTIYFAVVEALATAWYSTVEEVIAVSDFTQNEVIVGKRGTRAFKAKADILCNPKIRKTRQ